MKLRALAIASSFLIAGGFAAGLAGVAPPFRGHTPGSAHDDRFQVELATMASVGALSQQQVNRVFERELDGAYDCWRDRSTRVARNTTLEVKISPLGFVIGTEVVSSSGAPALDQCLARVAGRSVFPFAWSSTRAFTVWMQSPPPPGNLAL